MKGGEFGSAFSVKQLHRKTTAPALAYFAFGCSAWIFYTALVQPAISADIAPPWLPGLLLITICSLAIYVMERGGLADSSRERLRTSCAIQSALEGAAVGIVKLKLDGTILDASEQTLRILGYTADEMLGRQFQEITEPGDLYREMQLLEKVRSGEQKTYSIEKRYLTKDGRWLWVRKTVAVTEEPDREKCLIAIIEDISSTKKVDEDAKSWRSILDHANFGITHIDAGTNRIVIANPTYARERGYTPEELVGKNIDDVIAPEAIDAVSAGHRALIDIDSVTYEAVDVRKDGTKFPTIAQVNAIRDEHGNLSSRLVHVIDASQIKNTEAKLRNQEALLSAAMQSTNVGLALISLNRTYEYANPAYTRLVNADGSIVGRKIVDVLGQDRYMALCQPYSEQAFKGTASQFEFRIETQHGSNEWSTHSAVIDPRRDATGSITGVVVATSDVTKLKLAEQKLLENEERLRLAMTAAAIETIDHDILRDEIRLSAGLRQLLAIEGDRPLRLSDWLAFSIADQVPTVRRMIEQSLSMPGGAYSSERLMIGKDGVQHWLSILLKVHFDTLDGVERAVRSVGIVRNVTAKRLAQQQREALLEKQRESEELIRHQATLLQSVFDSSPVGIILVDPNRKITGVNPAVLNMFAAEMDDMIGQSAVMLYASSEDSERVKEAQERSGEAGIASFARIRFKRLDGSEFIGDLNGAVLLSAVGELQGYVGLVNDVSRQIHLEAMLEQSNRLEAVGRLTGGVAHDFNNLLTIVRTSLHLISMHSTAPETAEWIANAEQAVDMGMRLNQRLMTFARQRKLQSAIVDLNEILRSSREIIRRTLGESVTMSQSLSNEPATVLIDPSEIEGAILNLAFNARDAMPNGGHLSIVSDRVTLSEQAAQIGDGLKPGDFVRVSIIDTGHGMSEEVRSRAFEPFFTTKEVGKGTGLGLTTIHGLIVQSGGRISLESTVGKGTSVSILLPYQKVAVDSPSSAPRPSLAAKASHSGKLVLLVEDNEGVRRATSALLKAMGYRVIEASNGSEALAIVQAGGELDFVLSDIVMPGDVGGLELVERLEKLRPDIKTLLMSGFPDTPEGQSNSPKGTRFLQKPYTPEGLRRAMEDA